MIALIHLFIFAFWKEDKIENCTFFFQNLIIAFLRYLDETWESEGKELEGRYNPRERIDGGPNAPQENAAILVQRSLPLL